MRLRTFTAPTIADAMQRVRDELGLDAVILSTQRLGRGGGVKVTAGIETVESSSAGLAQGAQAAIEAIDAVGAALEFHGLPLPIADRLLAAAADLPADDAALALAGALDARFGFAPIVGGPGFAEAGGAPRPVMLVGTPGAGKTASVAKLATRARLAGRLVTAVTCDTLRAGAVEQLATYTRLLQIPAFRAKDAATLVRALDTAPAGALLLIDTVGSNPLDPRDMRALAELIDAARPELALVLAAGGDVAESAECAAAFAELGATRLIATRIDAARRLGGVLAAADVGRLSFAEFGVSPQIGDGLLPVNPVSLARLLLPETEVADATQQATGTSR
jgi:flagellar biosynthesis protein FlhF